MLQDLRFALRLAAKDRWFSAAAIVVLALGIGVNATGFTLVSGVFLRGRSLLDGREVYVLSWVAGARRWTMSWAEFQDWRAQSRSFASLAAVRTDTMNLSDDVAAPAEVYGARVSEDAFAVFEVHAAAGRLFTADDLRRDAPPVAVIAHHLWRDRYRGDPAVLGTPIRVNGTPATIVGVTREGAKFPSNAELWIPFIPTAAQESRSNRPLIAFGRLADSTSRKSAEAECAAIAARLIAAHPEDLKGATGISIENVPERFLGGSAPQMFLAMLAAVSFVLLIACANVANLLLSRSAYRAREVALRMALGATRRRVVRQLLIESVLLGIVGGAIGLALAYVGVQLFDRAVLDPTRPFWIVFTVDFKVFAYVAFVCVLTAILAGLAPALHVSRANLNDVLKEGARGSVGGGRAQWFSSTMVVAQLTLTIVLLAGAGLLARSFYNLRHVDNGFDTANLLTMRVRLPQAKYTTPDARRGFFDQLESRIAAIPGVQAAAATSAVPPSNNEERRIEIDGRPPTGEPPLVSVVRISAGFFDVVARPILRGRGFRAMDGLPESPGVVVNERLARQLFPAEDPVGRRVRFVSAQSAGTAAPPPPSPWRTIVGISPTIRHSAPSDELSDPVVYVPLALEPSGGPTIMVRTALPVAAVAADLRRAVQAIDPDQPVVGIMSLDDVLAERRWPYTAFGGAFAVFAIIALALASIGLYAVIAFAVAERTPEIGVRMALGARHRDVSWLFLRRAMTQLVIGLALGLGGAYALSGVLRSMLVRVAPHDPVTFTAISVILTVVAIAACVIPVRRATRIDPLAALRQG